jgi:undecaprenyl diphosphate synthase
MNASTPPPLHIAIIMDGNGRWAKSRNLPRTAGHQQGAEALKDILEGCKEFGIKHLTLYAFSSENWKRPQTEITDLMGLLRLYLNRELATLHKNNICIRIIGDRTRLDKDIQDKITECEQLTQHNTALHLTIALSYGSRQEIAHAARRVAEEVASGRLSADDVTEESFSQYLYTAGTPDPDLLIRTGGEERLSNFLLWQSAYTELYFTDILWPDFKKEGLRAAIEEFKRRERRYGTA